MTLALPADTVEFYNDGPDFTRTSYGPMCRVGVHSGKFDNPRGESILNASCRSKGDWPT